MTSLRMLWRGMADVLDHLLPYTIYSILWWICVLTIVLGPPATVALGVMTDPRRLDSQPDVREAIAAGKAAFKRAWGMALITVPVMFVLGNNIRYYASSGSLFAILIPLWVLLTILGMGIAVSGFTILALGDASVFTALKQAALLSAIKPFRVLLFVVLLWVIGIISGALVVPLIMFFPALVASVFDRHVLDGFGMEVPDPTAPTDERQAEALAERSTKKSRWSRN